MCWCSGILWLVIVVVSWNIFYYVFFKQKTAYEMRISDWSSDVCSSDLFVSVEDAHPDLDEEAEDAARDQQRPESRDHEIDLQAHIIEMPQPPRHAHQPAHVERREGAPEARHPQPERALAPFGLEQIGRANV